MTESPNMNKFSLTGSTAMLAAADTSGSRVVTVLANPLPVHSREKRMEEVCTRLSKM
jgi:hypothetical protein